MARMVRQERPRRRRRGRRLLHGDGHGCARAPLPSMMATNASSSDGSMRSRRRSGIRALASRLAIAARAAASSSAVTCSVVPNSATPAQRRFGLEHGEGAHHVVALQLEQRVRHVLALQRRRAAAGDDLAAVDEGDLVAVLGFVHVVRRDEHGDAARRRARRSSPRSCGATPGRRRRSARRGTGSAARAARRSRAPGAAASRRPAPTVRSCSRPRRPAISSAQAMRASRCAPRTS